MPAPFTDIGNLKIGIIGLGYVGLPLAVELGKRYPTIGLDINRPRVEELRNGHDSSLECSREELASATQLDYSHQIEDLATCNFFIVTVPTPIDEHKQPDLSPLKSASQSLGKIVKRGDIVVFESTVYPGATEEVCIPIIEQISGLGYNTDFYAGYSPERINPGDKEHRVANIKKVTSGSTPEVAEFVDQVYTSVILAGTHKASSIRVAEAAKVIENTQRDVNIALINELAIIFNKLGIDTQEVLEAAGSKWNFLPFRPGLVGGHCIGVDPYYLTHKAQAIGYQPEIILAGRRLNDSMGAYVVSRVIKLMFRKHIATHSARVLILGLAFKENCPDLRNTRVVDMVAEFQDYGIAVDVYDPWVNKQEALHEYAIMPIEQPAAGAYDAIVLAVAHREFAAMGAPQIRQLGKAENILYDVKQLLPADQVDGRL